jgi:hypothetical protein
VNRLALLGLLAAASFAAVDGTVVNRTTGKPQPGVVVTLYRLGGAGMQPVKTVKTDAQGAFRVDQQLEGPHLLQAIYDGVVYNRMLQPGSPSSGLELDVYNASAKVAGAKVSQHMVLLEPLGGVLHVNESIIFNNSANLTYNDPANGTLRVFLPETIRGAPRVTITAPQGMPVERSAVATKTPNVYKIDFPVKPGETRFDLTYVLPMPESKTFTGKVLHDGAPVRLVAPRGVTLNGAKVQLIGQEPTTQASVYQVDAKEYSVEIEGTGQLAAGDDTAQGGGRGIQTIPARIYDQLWAILGLAFLILLLGFILLYRRGPATGTGSR